MKVDAYLDGATPTEKKNTQSWGDEEEHTTTILKKNAQSWGDEEEHTTTILKKNAQSWGDEEERTSTILKKNVQQQPRRRQLKNAQKKMKMNDSCERKKERAEERVLGTLTFLKILQR